MGAKVVVHKNEGSLYKEWRFALCGCLGGRYLERLIVNRWTKVTCKRCLRMASKAVKVRLGIA